MADGEAKSAYGPLDEDVPGDVTLFLNRASIDDLCMAKDREISKGPIHARWWFVRMIDAAIEDRKAVNRKPHQK